MKCPNCSETLLMTQRNNVEIDYCPKCRGIWLDKGELDKLLEYDNKRSNDEHHRYDNDHDHDRHKQHPRKKRGFLGDFFDFD
ncbi:zf-TFIIB domain-containing protein [Chitinophaga niabensis]|uniref:TFIIB-type zinc ribbon-containing protein n=1 Tax=Chitinophaga niabensis TaxID=536979 RepID=UPI0031BAD93E